MNLQIASVRIFLLVLCCTFILKGTVYGKESFKVAGLLTISTPEEDDSPEKTAKRPFLAVASGNEFCVETGPVAGSDVLRWRLYGNETNSYLVVDDPPPSGKVIRVHKGNNDYIDVLDTTLKDKFITTKVTAAPWLAPTLNSSDIAPVWLAFCSGNYLTSHHEKVLDPIGINFHEIRQEGLQVQADWALTSTAPLFPKNVVYFTDGNDYSMTLTGMTKRKSAPPFDRPTTNVIFYVSEWTNVAELTFPHIFRLIQLAPKRYGLNTNDLKVVKIYEGITTNISRIVGASEVTLTLPSKCEVIERRFSRMNPPIAEVAYVITNGQIASLDKVRNYPMYASAVHRLEKERSKKVTRLIIYALFGGLLVFPFVATRLWRVGRTEVHNTKQTKERV